MKELVVFAPTEMQVSFIITGKLQMNNLENRFGKYLQLVGVNYNITVTPGAWDWIQIKSYLALYSAQNGNLPLSTNILEQHPEPFNTNINTVEFNDVFLDVLENGYWDVRNLDSSDFVYVCGYTSFKLGVDLKCKDCNSMILKHECNDVYFTTDCQCPRILL